MQCRGAVSDHTDDFITITATLFQTARSKTLIRLFLVDLGASELSILKQKLKGRLNAMTESTDLELRMSVERALE